MWIVVGTASEFAIICNTICTILTNVLPYIIKVDLCTVTRLSTFIMYVTRLSTFIMYGNTFVNVYYVLRT
jgi:hypothetical protein